MATEADHSAISPDFVRDRCEKSGFLFGVYGYCVPSSDRRSRAVFANVLGVSGAGKIVPQNWTTLLIAFVWAITVGWLGALPGEIAWRGFLEHNVTVTRFGKYCFIGLVWGVWNLPVVAFVAAGQSMGERIAYMGCVLLMCVICSFYYASALHRTRTLFVPALLQGLIFRRWLSIR